MLLPSALNKTSYLLLEELAILWSSQNDSLDYGGMFLVGGLVRDIILDPKSMSEQRSSQLDIDISLEGDALKFIEALKNNSEELGALGTNSCFRVLSRRKFKKYGTAKVVFENIKTAEQQHVDFAQCRSEVYQQPGAKPIISRASIEQDLWRRDFSINAIALRLHTNTSLELSKLLVDPCKGVEAISRKEIAVLHDMSFSDDPMRLIRAQRFVSRFGFTLSEKTTELFEQACRTDLIERVSGARRFDEFRKAIGETQFINIIKGLSEKGLLQKIHPLVTQAYLRHLPNLAQLASKVGEKERLDFLFSKLSDLEKSELIKELGLGSREKKLIGPK